MKKKILTSLFVLLVTLPGCGYEPIFSSKSINSDKSISIEKIIFESDNKINYLFERKLKFFQKKIPNSEKFNLILNIEENKKILSKNKVGDPETFDLEIITRASIFNNKDVILYSSNFKSNKNYNNLENKFDLRQEENIIKNNLVDEIVNEIISKIFEIQ